MAIKNDTLEACARRMTATLARSPRHPRTRAYLATLPKRERVIVDPSDFLSATFQPYAQEHSFLASPEPRKDRLRPKASGETARMRYRLADAQDGRCGACGYHMHDGDVTIDHVVPKRHGGANHFSNYLAMHGRCNHDKSDRMPNAFEIMMNERKNARMLDA